MAKRPPLEVADLTENLKTSKGQGMGVFFPTPLSNEAKSVEKSQNIIQEEIKKESNTIYNKRNKKEENNENNVISNITILQITDKDISSLRELAEKPQTYRLTHKDIEYIKDMAYRLSKESKRGKIGQGDILRIALVLFDKFITSNKDALQTILEKIK